MITNFIQRILHNHNTHSFQELYVHILYILYRKANKESTTTNHVIYFPFSFEKEVNTKWDNWFNSEY
jgi:hypothetical protein